MLFQNVFKRYDKWIFGCTMLMLAMGLLLVSSTGFCIEQSHHWGSFMFLKKHIIFLILGVFVCFLCSVSKQHLRLGWIILIIGVVLMLLTYFFGVTIKGAKRWINVGGLSIQPAEIMKLGMVMVWSNLLSNRKYAFAGLLFIISAVLLLTQPDFGSLLLLSCVILVLLFANGIQFRFISLICLLFMLMLGSGYLLFPHVQKRVHTFLQNEQAGKDEKYNKRYQINKATQSFKTAGLFGKGPGSGKLKYQLPDAHADFVFTVVGEEFGILGCIVLVVLLSCFLTRIFVHLKHTAHIEQQLLIIGLSSLILIQSWFHMLSNLNLMPTKGFAMPLLGYGGTGLVTTLACMGFLLNITQNNSNHKIFDKF